jgi:beta-ureidopropionase / N-carbamoyl-L-amino-acid hydrolase
MEHRMTQPAFPEPDIALAERLFDAFRANTAGRLGVVRDTYGKGEEAAHRLVRESAISLELEVAEDAARNLYLTLPGADRTARSLVMGSHLDSVPEGGNYDGAAGVLAGIAVLAGFKRAGHVPPFDLTVAAFRAEESAWFDVAYCGSHAAFGKLPPVALDVRRSDTGRPLSEHMRDAGCDVAAVRAGTPFLDPARLRGYIELHIEQGPVLEAGSFAVGIVSGIRGCLRFRRARCLGAYAHSGAEPRRSRRDAVAATVALVQRLKDEWERLEETGEDLAFTVGELTTDPAQHGPSKVAGETRFVLDFRSLEDTTMHRMAAFAERHAAELATRYRVQFTLGEPSYSAPARLDTILRQGFTQAAQDLGIPTMVLASGAGHDAVVFATAGVPSAMIFVRNQHGSHNPHEAMAIEDFAAATRILAWHLVHEAAA